MSFADRVSAFFHRSGDKVHDVADKVDTDKVKDKATEAADAVKNKVSGDK